MRRLLGFESRFQVHALLKEHHVPLHYAAADFEDDLRAQRELGISAQPMIVVAENAS